MKRRAVTLWPEWAAAIAWLDKRCENRTWEPSAAQIGPGGWVCIHAGGTVGGLGRAPKTRELFEAHLEDRADALRDVFDMAARAGWSWSYDASRPVDMAGRLDQLVDLRHAEKGVAADPRQIVLPSYSAIVAVARVVGVDREERTGWDVPGAVHWRLADVRRLAEPVSCRGAQGLWLVPDDVAAAVRERLPPARSVEVRQ